MTELDYNAPDSDLRLLEPGQSNVNPSKALSLQRLLVFLARYWWIPLVTLAIGAGVAMVYAMWSPPIYVSRARMWETVKLHLPEESIFAEDGPNFLGTQTELLQSGRCANWRLSV